MTRTFDFIVQSMSNGPAPDVDPSDSKIVLFETLWSDPADGWAVASRANARAMKQAGIDVRLHSWAPVSEHWKEIQHEVKGMLTACPKNGWGFYVFSTTLASADRMEHPLNLLRSFRAPRSFYTTFERTYIEPKLATMLRDLDGIWVPCRANQSVLEDAGVKSDCIPFPFFPDDPHLKLEPISHEPKVFYWIGRWEPRKAPDNLVRAFIRAFSPGQAKLRMKFSPIPWALSQWLTFDQVVEQELAASYNSNRGWSKSNVYENIEVIDKRLSVEEMVALHAEGDVYVTSSRGEGTDLPALQAKLSSRRVVATESGGPEDFLGPNDIKVPSDGLVAVDPAYGWGPGAMWTEYKLDALVEALQAARSSRSDPTVWPKKNFEAATVGRQFVEWIKKSAANAGREW